MAEVVNLRRFRKAKGRAEREAEAQGNRVLHGTSKAERHASAARAGIEDRTLDGHRRVPARTEAAAGRPDE